MKLFFPLLVAFTVLLACSDEPVTLDLDPIDEMYFPPISQTTWETMSLTDAEFNESNLPDLLDYLEEKHTKGFIILKNGRIVIEEYFNGHSQSSSWYWASAAKTLTATTIGIAQSEGYLNINDATTNYLGAGWTSATTVQENAITIKHQLSMTTGLDDGVADPFSYEPQDLQYLNQPDVRWAYHNGPYTLLQEVISNATSQDFRNYFYEKIRDKIGMDGFWMSFGNIEVYTSTTRSMARFGLLALNDFIWHEVPIIHDEIYTHDMINTSQNINPSYGYLWWLNGKNSYMMPQLQYSFSGSLVPDAPSDMYIAMGKNDQRIYVIPSQNLVVIRMGEVADNSNLALSDFDLSLWSKINTVINN